MSGAADHPPRPYGTTDLDELAARLRQLLVWAGVSYRELHRSVVRARRRRGVVEVPTYNTVYRCFQPGRARIDVELLVDIARTLLRDDGLAAEWRYAHQLIMGEAARASVVSVSDRLPDDDPHFVGRAAELATLLSIPDGGPVVVSAINGMAGVGKTRLAVHAAHMLQRRGRYADRQLAVNLRGFDAELPPADPAAVLDAFLRHLGVPGAEIHRLSLAERSARFQALMVDRSAMVLLDNAATEDQVAPLLPHSSTCLVLITSRRELNGLRGARHLPLDVFTEADAVALLRASSGQRLINQGAATAAGIARMAGRLPLALALAASRIRHRPHWTLADHLDQLAEHASRLRLDDRVDVALRLSYAALGADQQRLLRLLALHPGRDFEITAVSALAGGDLATIDRQLTDLRANNVLQRRSAGRYELHDLVRIFAAACSRDEDPSSARRAALTRLLDHYRFTAAQAADLYAPQEKHRRPRVADPATPAVVLPDRAAAAAWLEAERANLMSVVDYAADQGWSTYVGEMSMILYPFFDLSGYYQEAVALHSRASEIGNDRSRAYALTQLGTVYWRTGRMAEAVDCFERSAELFERIGDRAGRARAVGNEGLVFQGTGRYDEALACHQLAAGLFHQVGDATGESRVFGNAGCVRVSLGQYTSALADFDRSLALAWAVDDQAGAGATLANLGCCHEKLGNYAEALHCHEQALAIARQVGHRDGEAQSMTNIGVAHALLGQPEQALKYQEEALEMARASGNRQVEVKARNAGGTTLRLLGRLEEAAQWHQEALWAAVEMGDREEEARAHAGIGTARAALGALGAARTHWRLALDVFRAIGAPEVDEIAATLDAAGRPDTFAGEER